MTPGAVMRGLAAVLAAFLFTGFGHGDSWFSPSSEADTHWAAHDPDSGLRPDNRLWAELLSRRVAVDADGVARFDYAGVTPQERRNLDAQIAAWEDWPVLEAARPWQQAYWINLYNALTVRVVLDHYPVGSIREIDLSSGWFSFSGPWSAPVARVDGKALSLDHIEHRILRPLWKDPRVHYAVNCASVGCPNLRAEPWRGDGMDAGLEEAARAYVNSPRGVSVIRDRVVVSGIYAWFAEDFGGTDAGVLRHLRRYADADLRARLAAADGIGGIAYDWSLNSPPTPR